MWAFHLFSWSRFFSNVYSIVLILAETLIVLDDSDDGAAEPKKRKAGVSITKLKQKTLPSTFNEPYNRKGVQHKKLTHAITKYLVKDGQPAYATEKEGFREMLYEFDRRYMDLKLNVYFDVNPSM